MKHTTNFITGKRWSWLLSCWHQPSRQVVKPTIVLLISVSFLFPTISWAFDIENYLYSAIQGIQLGEGGSGIIPTLELATIPESPAKRAVSEYFMKQGKLTGADYLIINDRPDLELFGAEDARLYNSSLALIRQFTTEENRGLVIEILDQLGFIQEKAYNPSLLAFENRRKYYLKGDSDNELYLRILIREATQAGIALVPSELQKNRKQRELNYHEKAEQQNYLETTLREAMFLTSAERQLYQFQVYMELVERTINVSASHEDLKTFQALSQSISIKKISEALKANLGNSYFNLTEDVGRLENALQQAQQFYQFADQRDQALYRNALQRIDDRQEQKVILITGGYHTAAIQDQIKQAGYSCITIQPDMSKAESGTQYFELLRYPDQQTEFEKMIARQATSLNAMAVRNFLTFKNFRNHFNSAVDFVNLTAVRMSENDFVRLPGVTLKRVRKKLVEITSLDGSAVMGLLFKRQGMELIGQREVVNYLGESTLLASSQVQSFALALLGVAVFSITILPLMGISAAISPALMLMGLSIVIISGWWMANHKGSDFLSRVFTKRNIILASMVIGAIALPVISQVIVADVTSAVATGTVGEVSNLQLLLGGVTNIFRIFPEMAAMTPLAHNPVQVMTAIAGTAQVLGSMAMTPIFSGLRFNSIIPNNKIRDKKNSNEVLQRDFADLAIDEARAIIQRRDKERHGEKYEKGQARPAQGAFEIVPESNAAVMLNALVQNGLVRFEDNTPVDFSVKDIQMMEGDYIDEVPTSSEILFQFPKRKGGSAHVLFRVLLLDPRFVDKDGKPVYKEIPQEYVTAVMGNLNPFKLFLAYSKELPELLAKAGDQAEGFEKLIKYVAKQWKDKQAPEDFETMREFVTIGMLHEFTHGLALHLPDAIPADASEETRRDLEPITFDKYLALINSDQKLQTSVVFNKNLLKALRAVKNMDEKKNPQSRINSVLALEMFCDRFSMFLYENYAKIRIYSENFKTADVAFSVDVDSMLNMEAKRREGALRKMRGLENVLRDEEFSKLETELAAAESAHMYISKFGDPKLSAEEIDFYTKFLGLVKYFDGEKQIMRFTMDHADKSRFMHASVDGLTRENGIGVSDVIRTSENIGDLAEGVMQAVTQRKTGRSTIVDYEKKDIDEDTAVGG